MNQRYISPLVRYKNDLKENELFHDINQEQVVEQLDILFYRLMDEHERTSILANRFLRRNRKIVTGLYLWGGVGRGKTYLMDLFFETLPIKQKKRLHFHRFMFWVHQELTECDGLSDPLVHIAKKLAKETQILCFDEFFVSDIGDAMILAGLLQEIFRLGICFIATSNVIPDKLYRNGLQRSRFLPAIDLIEKNTQVLNIGSGIDYRLRALEQAEIYHSPLDEAAEENLQFSFSHLAVGEINEKTTILINGREINVCATAEGVVWFDFRSICTSPRGAKDYIELSRLNHSVLISDIPRLDDDINDQVRRFISLVDEFYERNVKLIISAVVPLSELYQGKSLDFEFNRTKSRLREMGSHDYLAKEHLP